MKRSVIQRYYFEEISECYYEENLMKNENEIINVMLPSSDLLPHSAPSLALEILLDPQPKFLLGLGL